MKEVKKTGCFDKKNILAILMYSVFLGIAGCSLARNPVPIAQMPNAELINIKMVRTWGGQFSPHFQKDLVESIRQEREGDFPLKPDGSTSYSALALSGGGANGQ